MGKANIDYFEMSNKAIIGLIGDYVKQHRLDRNFTQENVAKDAGVNRWTVGQIERGESITLVSLIQILRSLDLLDVMDSFQYKKEVSPIELAEIERKKKRRARGKSSAQIDESEW